MTNGMEGEGTRRRRIATQQLLAALPPQAAWSIMGHCCPLCASSMGHAICMLSMCCEFHLLVGGSAHMSFIGKPSHAAMPPHRPFSPWAA